jgi:hypothetical protein
MTRRIALASLFILAATTLFAQQLPPGKWWRRPDVAQSLQLSEDQQMRLDQIWRASASDLIDVKADIDKQAIALRGELDQPTLNRNAIRAIAARLNEARGKKFERELMMFVDMRAVLNDQQWNRMRAKLDSLGEEPMMRRNQRRQQ